MFKLKKDSVTRLIAGVESLLLLSTLVACGSKNDNKAIAGENNGYETTTDNSNETKLEEKNIVENFSTELKKNFPNMNSDIIDNTTMMLLLDHFAKRDEYGKISASEISKYVSRINADEWVRNFSIFLDEYEKEFGKTFDIGSLLPDEFKNDKEILHNIYLIANNIQGFSNLGDKDKVLVEYNKIYSLFVEGKELDVDSFKFKVLDLNPVNRAIANRYAQIAAYYARNYIDEESYSKLDRSVDNQNNKAQTIIKLEVLSNQLTEISNENLKESFNKKYDLLKQNLSNVNISDETIKNLVNRINLRYLTNYASYKDQKDILGEYNEDMESNMIFALNVIYECNYSMILNNKTNVIRLSDYIIDEYKNTELGKIDAIALDHIQLNSLYAQYHCKELNLYDNYRNSDAFESIRNYILKKDFEHKYSNNRTENITWSEISDGASFVNYTNLIYALNKLPRTEVLDNNIEVANEKYESLIKEIQVQTTGECVTKDFEYVYKK